MPTFTERQSELRHQARAPDQRTTPTAGHATVPGVPSADAVHAEQERAHRANRRAQLERRQSELRAVVRQCELVIADISVPEPARHDCARPMADALAELRQVETELAELT